MSVGPITVILASLSPGDPTSDLHVFRVSYGAKGSAVGVTDRPQNTVTVKTCSNMLKPKPAFPGGLDSPYPSRQVHDSEFHASELQDLKIRPGVCDRKMSFIQQIQGKNTKIKPTIMGM